MGSRFSAWPIDLGYGGQSLGRRRQGLASWQDPPDASCASRLSRFDEAAQGSHYLLYLLTSPHPAPITVPTRHGVVPGEGYHRYQRATALAPPCLTSGRTRRAKTANGCGDILTTAPVGHGQPSMKGI